MKQRTKQKRSLVSQKASLKAFVASDGTEISVGKNNYQNDRLTLKTAKKDYYWLHVKVVPGSHVIVNSDSPSDETLTEAAIIAAYYSKSRASANVAVEFARCQKNSENQTAQSPGSLSTKVKKRFMSRLTKNLSKN